MVVVDRQPLDFMQWTWKEIGPRYETLARVVLTPENVGGFMADWTELLDRVQELGHRLKSAADADTADKEADARFHSFVTEIIPRVEEAEQQLTEKLLECGIVPEGMEAPLERMRVDVELFREDNLPLLSEERVTGQEYLKVTGAETIEWEGRTIPITQVRPLLEDTDRARRENAWTLAAEARYRDRDRIDEIWRKLLTLRRRIAANAGFDDYRTYRWRALKRFDYTPDDTKQFHRSVEAVVVPAVEKLFARRRRLLGLDTLRPWDLNVDVLGRPPLRPYREIADLTQKSSAIFHRVDPALGSFFDTMRGEGLLDLDARLNKAPGGYCTAYPASRRPFIFMSGSGTSLDVETVLHEGGHAFHVFLSSHLPYSQQRGFDLPMEFAEVASMAMELLAEPYLPQEEGGFYSRSDAARARFVHLEDRVLILWCRIAAGDAFQHWVYEHPEEAADGDACDRVWLELVNRFVPGIDRTGLEKFQASGWRDILHFFEVPFYFIEYAFAQLGAVQVWAIAQVDETEAVRRYRHALSLGGTARLPELFEAAGARFAFDEETLRGAVSSIERTLADLDREQAAS